ncbi:MAG: dedA [Bacillales bacterium]|jgi:membrane-associated protein|nr:dedA [Bacillales bacterium]
MIEFFKAILHIDTYISQFIDSYGFLTYFILFFIIFLETGFVVTPFLPGDSLLFAAGAFAAKGDFNIFLLWILLISASILGDNINYYIGRKIGKRLAESRFVRVEYLLRAEGFYEKYGGKAIIVGKFMPIVRTFVPFVAGIGKMNYPRFLSRNIAGAFIWITLFLVLGYFFGNIQFVKENFSIVTIGIIAISFLPVVYTFIQEKMKSKK